MIDFEKYQNEISSICEKYRVKNLSVFGSATSEHFNSQSDIDFLIELDSPKNGMKRYMNIKFELENLFSRPVDLVMPKAIKNKRIKQYIFSETRKLYAA
uniref:nucleotidyltransferase family protein n=1 Tax=Candidatus Electronema sp. TaxID=2698783 RepID=UPI004057B940